MLRVSLPYNEAKAFEKTHLICFDPSFVYKFKVFSKKLDQINVPQFFTLGQKFEDNDLVRSLNDCTN